jgi:hypothetical protein
MEDGNSLAIAEAIPPEGFPDLRRSGLMKVMAGLTSLQEMDRITVLIKRPLIKTNYALLNKRLAT